MKNSRLKNLVIIIVCIILIALICMVLYDYIDSKNNKIKKIDETKDIYYFVYGNEYSLFVGKDDDSNHKLIGSIQISYPVINIDKIDVKEINNIIRAKVLKEEASFLQNATSGYIYVNKDNTFYRREIVNVYSYQVSVYKNIVSIVEKTTELKENNEGTIKYRSYNIKMNGYTLNNSAILNLYHFDETKFLNQLKEYIGKEYQLESLFIGLQENSIDIYINDSENAYINYDGNDFTSKMIINDFNKEMEE